MTSLYSKKSKEEIRLLKLHPGGPNDPIRCELITKPLKSVKEEYEAISYLWGDMEDTVEIMCDECKIPVTRNLSDALSHLRFLKETRTLWADAICINQGDKQEKSIEVAQMAHVYLSASQTIVYLSQETEASNLAIDFIGQLSHVANEFQQLINMLHDQAYRQQWTALCEILNNRYWARIWIAQEIAVARKVVLQIGTRSIELDHFTNVISKLVDFYINNVLGDIHIVFPQLQLNAVWAVLEARRRYKSNNKPKLDELLILFLSSKATEPVDKVYGVYSMCIEAWPHQLPLPIYGIPFSIVYVATVQAIIETSGSLDILSALNYPFASPSWCPKLDGSSPKCLPSYESNWRCAGSRKLDVNFLDGRIMRVKGFLLDRVSYVVPTNNLHMYDASARASEMKEILLAMTWSPYGDDGYRLLALLDTLTLESPSQVVLKARTALKRLNCVYNEESGEDTNIYNTWFIRRLLEEGSHPWLVGQSRRKHRNHAKHRSIALTNQGYICLLPETTREGDEIVVLYGGRVPFCVRRAGFGDCGEVWRFVGDCYVHGIMQGQAMETVNPRQERCFDFI